MNHMTHEADNDCIFCKIIAGDIPCHKVYEDADTLAFLDIRPNNPGHVLVISKDHFENIYSLPAEALCKLFLTVQKVALAVKNGADADGINIVMNNEPAAGQEVFHAHVHVIPRGKDDNFLHWPHKTYMPGEAEDMAKKISTELQSQ